MLLSWCRARMSDANTSHQIEEQRKEHSQKGSELKSCRNKLWKRRTVRGRGVGSWMSSRRQMKTRHVLGPKMMLVHTWFGEICIPLLLKLACHILAIMYKHYFQAWSKE